MCKFTKIDLASNWVEKILTYPKQIIESSSVSENENLISTFEYPNERTVIRTDFNEISKTKTQHIVEFNEYKEPLKISVFFFINNNWVKSEETQYTYNPKENLKYCIRTRFSKDQNVIVEKSKIQIFKTDKSLKKITTFKDTSNQSVEEFKYDDSDREIEFQMYDIHDGERKNVLKTTNQFENNIENYSVFSTKDIESNKWLMTSKTVTEVFPDKSIQITDEYVNNSKEKHVKYFNDSEQLLKNISYDFVENEWKLDAKTEYEYSHNYLSKEIYFSFENDVWILEGKTEFENLGGYLTKEISFNKKGQSWLKFSEKLYEYK